MNGNLAQFGKDLQLHLFRLQKSLDNINRLFAADVMVSEATFANRLDELSAMTLDHSEQSETLRKALQSGAEQDVAAETILRWIGKRQSARLHARADTIERLAAVTVELAALSMLEAERMTMTALLARRDAMSAQVQHGRPE